MLSNEFYIFPKIFMVLTVFCNFILKEGNENEDLCYQTYLKLKKNKQIRLFVFQILQHYCRTRLIRVIYGMRKCLTLTHWNDTHGTLSW